MLKGNDCTVENDTKSLGTKIRQIIRRFDCEILRQSSLLQIASNLIVRDLPR